MAPLTGQKIGGNVLQEACRLVSQYLLGDLKCANFLKPDEVQANISLSLGEPLDSAHDLLVQIQQYLEMQPKTFHPHFANQLYGGTTLAGIVGGFYFK